MDRAVRRLLDRRIRVLAVPGVAGVVGQTEPVADLEVEVEEPATVAGGVVTVPVADERVLAFTRKG